jgi:hypothetical protein
MQRLAYLDAIGIDSYISRAQLPAAAPSRRLRIVRPAVPVGAEPEKPPSAVQDLLSDVLRQDSPSVGSARKPSVSAQPAAAVSTAADATPVFSVSACFLAGYCWLSEVPRARELGAEYGQLLQAICLALGWDARSPVLERFDWPMGNSRQLDQGPEAARHGFEGFIRARLERHPVRGVILLGEPESPWLDRSIFGDIEWHSTLSARDMLKQPELKIRAWRDLKPLAGSRA